MLLSNALIFLNVLFLYSSARKSLANILKRPFINPSDQTNEERRPSAQVWIDRGPRRTLLFIDLFMPTTFIFFIAVSLICHWAGGDFSKKSKNYGDVPQGLEPTIYQPTPRVARLGSSP